MAELNAVKTIIRSCLISSDKKEGINVRQLFNDYKLFEGSPIPFRNFGFNNLEDFLHSIPDVCRFSYNGFIYPVTTEENKHISEMVSKSKKPRRQPSRPNFRNNFKGNNFNSTHNHFSSFYTSQNFNNRQSSHSYYNNNRNYHYAAPSVVNYAPTYYYQSVPTTSVASYYPEQQQSNFNINPYSSNGKEEKQAILRPPYTDSSGSSEYDFQPPTSTTEKPASQDLIDFDREIQLNTENTEIRHKAQINEKVAEKSDQSTFNYSTSILDSSFDIQDTVSNVQVEVIQKGVEAMNFEKREENCSSSEFARFSQQDDTKCLSNQSTKNPFIARSSSDPFDHIADDDIIFTMDHPPFAGEDFKIPDNKIYYKTGDTYRIFISEVHSPSKFWYHDGDHCYILDDLMNDLEIYYKELHPHDLKFHESRMTVGHVCAALVFDFWHRGEIVSKPENGKVRIFFLDYGSTMNIDVANVKYLLTEFAKTPRQAFRGCLHGIAPRDNSLFWDLDATKEMLEYISNKPLWALCNRIVEDTNVAQLSVIYVKKQEEININRILLFKGYAKLATESMTVNGKIIRGIGPICYEYPSFEALETTCYPSYGERQMFKKKYDIDYNILEYTYLFMGVDESVLKRDEIVKAIKLTHIPIIKKIKAYFLYKQEQPVKRINVE